MTDRINALTVVLERDNRTDDVQVLIDAISLFQGVLSVKANVADLESHVAYQRVRHELGEKLLAVVYPKDGER